MAHFKNTYKVTSKASHNIKNYLPDNTHPPY